MKKLLSLTLRTLCTFLIVSSSLSATDEASPKEQSPLLIPEEEYKTDENTQVITAGSRRLSQSEEAAIKEQRLFRSAQAEHEDKNNDLSSLKAIKNRIPLTIASTTKKDGKNGEKTERISHGVRYYSSHEDAIHTALTGSNYYEKVKLNDGTIWSVASYDWWKVQKWLTTDEILILPNHISYFYDYLLVNAQTGDYVDVNLTELEVLSWDPSYYGNRHWIVSIDYFSNFVTLEDGSIWDVSFEDDGILRHWYVGDVVTIGINDGWDSAIRLNILVHFNTLNYVRAECLN
jgi:hypothetical protein